MTLDFTADGHAHCLYDEAIDLRTLGALHVRRASHIEFNEVTQQWEVSYPDSDQVVFADASRSACLDWERQHCQGDCRNRIFRPPHFHHLSKENREA